MLDLATLGQISDTALTRETAFAMTAAGLPNTFVPGRNLLFFTYAAALAYRRGIRTLVGGMCETDFSGYPDCRNDTLQTLAKAISLGMDAAFAIETPLMWIDKAGTWAMAEQLGGAALVDLIVEHTHTCYTPDRTTRHAWGYGCGNCPACDLRAKGWEKWQSRQELIRAVDLAIAGDWDGAHKIVQAGRGRRNVLLDPCRAAQDRGRAGNAATGIAAPASPTRPIPTPRRSSPPSRPCWAIDPMTTDVPKRSCCTS